MTLKEFRIECEKLVGKRMTRESITKEMARIFNDACAEIVEAGESESYESRQWDGDYWFMYNSPEDCFVDIYYLPTRKEGVLYITEVDIDW